MAAELGVPVTLLVGCITSLWAKMSAHAKRGDLEKISEKVVEAWARWDGPSGAFYAAFASRFLRNGRVKNWDQYNGKPIRDAELDAKRKREARRRKFLGLSARRPPDAPPDVLRSGGRTDETDETDETDVKKRTNTHRDLPAAEAFEAFWATYPPRSPNPRKLAEKAWSARVREGIAPQDLVDGAARYAAFVAHEKTPGRFIQQAATFLGPHRRWADPYTIAAPATLRIYDEHGEPTPEAIRALGLTR